MGKKEKLLYNTPDCAERDSPTCLFTVPRSLVCVVWGQEGNNSTMWYNKRPLKLLTSLQRRAQAWVNITGCGATEAAAFIVAATDPQLALFPYLSWRLYT